MVQRVEVGQVWGGRGKGHSFVMRVSGDRVWSDYRDEVGDTRPYVTDQSAESFVEEGIFVSDREEALLVTPVEFRCLVEGYYEWLESRELSGSSSAVGSGEEGGVEAGSGVLDRSGGFVVEAGAQWSDFDDERHAVGVVVGSGGVKIGVGESNRVRFLLPVEKEGADGRVRKVGERVVLEVGTDGFCADNVLLEDKTWGLKVHSSHDKRVYRAMCDFLDGCGAVEDLIFVILADDGSEVEKLRVSPGGFHVDGRKLDEGELLPDHLHDVYWKLMGVMARGRASLQERVRELERMLD